MSGGDVLLTGATGFVGMELVARYLERSDRDLITLVRAADDASAQRADERRPRRPVRRAGGGLPRSRPRRGGRCHDSEPRPDAPRCATSSPSGPRRSSTRPRRCRSRCRCPKRGGSTPKAPAGCWSWPSSPTSAVAWTATGRSRPRSSRETMRAASPRPTSNVGQQFHNSYEQSKFESELLVAATDLPTRVMRPSIVVGERVSGWTAAFNVVYWPLRAFSRGLFDVIPADPSAPVDVVPIDYVADAVYALCGDAGSDGQTYHLTAGPHASTMLELCTMASRYFDRPPPRVVTAEEFAKLPPPSVAVQQAFTAGAAYFPYFAMEGTFERRGHARAAGAAGDPLLAAAGLHRPAVGLRDPQPLGQGPDPARRGARDPGRRRAGGLTRRQSSSPQPGGWATVRLPAPDPGARRSLDPAARRHRPVSPR